MCFVIEAAQLSLSRGARDFFRRFVSHNAKRFNCRRSFSGKRICRSVGAAGVFESAKPFFAGASHLVLFYLCCCAEGKESPYHLGVIGVCDSLGAAILLRAQRIGVFGRRRVDGKVEDLAVSKAGAGGQGNKRIFARLERLVGR